MKSLVHSAGGEAPHYRRLLLREFYERKAKNPLYSVRAFARGLQINKTTLAAVLAGKRDLSVASLRQVAERLQWSPDQISRAQREASRREPSALELRTVEDDVFHSIADWYHYALLNLAQLEDTPAAASALAPRLGLDEATVQAALDRLFRIGLLLCERGFLRRATAGLATRAEIPSAAVRKHQVQMLELAAASLERDALPQRDFSTMAMAIDPARLPEAKAMIRNFRHKLCAFLEGGTPSEVYNLGVQLFPLTRSEK